VESVGATSRTWSSTEFSAALCPMISSKLWCCLIEEKFLRRELPGYDEYITRTRFRMIPYVW
jgi:protein-S-isoprenylcysteine O-methyltransferase Ste14